MLDEHARVADLVAKELQWEIREPFGLAWTEEHLLLDAPASAQQIGAVTDGSQVYAAQHDPTRHALAVSLDVPAGADFTLAPTDDTPPPTSLRVARQGDALVLGNAHCTIHLATHADVYDAGDTWVLSGPIVAVLGPDGRPRGASEIRLQKTRFFAHDRASIARLHPEQIAAMETAPTVEITLLAKGPVFARYQYHLITADGTYTFTATLYADHPMLYVDEQSTLARDGNFHFALSERFPCDLYCFGGSDRPQTVVPLPPGPYRLGSLAPHHTQSHVAYPWMGFLQSARPQSDYRGIGDTELHPYADALVVMAHKPWEWDYPSEVTLHFTCDAARRVSVDGSLREGHRAWCLLVLPRAEVERVERFPLWGQTREVATMCRWHRQINDVPFDWLRRLDLASGAVTPQQFPQSMLTAEEYAAKQAELFPALVAELGDGLAAENTAALYARWLLLGDREAAQTLSRQLLARMEEKLALAYHSGFLPDALCAVANRGLGPDAIAFEACVAAGVLSPEEQTRLQRIFLFFAYATTEDALFPSHHNYWPPDHPRAIRNWATTELYSDLFGTPNFQTDVYYNLGLFGAVFAQHPQADAWLAEAATQLDAQLAAHFHPGGVYKESIGYFLHLFHNMLHLASVLRRHGQRDFYADARFQGAMNTLVDYLGAPRRHTLEAMLHPAQATPGLHRHYPSIGDTGHQCMDADVQALLAHAAWEVRAHNPALSDKLLAAWQENGRPLLGHYAPQYEYVYVQQLHPQPPALAPQLASRNFVNIGQLLRADVGQPGETSVFFRSGRATHHWGFDHGHVTMTTRGSLLIPDFGYHGSTEPTSGTQVPGWASWVHNVVTFGDWWNAGHDIERTGPERIIKLGADMDYVVADMSVSMVRGPHWRDAQRITAVEYFRHLLFAHNRYLLVWDRIDFSIYRSQLRINCLARETRIDGGQIHFTGLDDVDLRVTMLAPEAPTFAEGMVGPMRYLLCEQPCQRDYLWLCQPLAPGETPFTVTNTPNHITVAGTDLHGTAFEDHILYAKGDFDAEVAIDGQRYRLDGRLAVLHREGGVDDLRLYDAQGCTVIE